MVNNKCPVCRHPLTTHTCKMCGYQQQVMKVQTTQQIGGGRLNLFGRIRHKAVKAEDRYVTTTQKMHAYLREYGRTLKAAANALATAQQINNKGLHQTVLEIWKGLLFKNKRNSISSWGILNKYIFGKGNQRERHGNIEPQNKMDGGDEQIGDENEENEPNLGQNTEKKTKKRGRNTEQAQKITGNKHSFRVYYNKSVKHLLMESINLRKTDSRLLTPMQRAFLSELVTVEPDPSFLKWVSAKYMRMLLAIRNNSCKQSFINQKVETRQQLQSRGCRQQSSKQNSIVAIILVDLLKCLKQEQATPEGQQGVVEWAELQYKKWQEQANSRCEIVELCLEKLLNSGHSLLDNEQGPVLSFTLIYAILFIASTKLGLYLTVSEIMSNVGGLNIPAIDIEGVFLPAVVNTENITPSRVRRQAHLLTSWLSVPLHSSIKGWTAKWCQQLQIQSHCSAITAINKCLFEQISVKSQHKSGTYYPQSHKKVNYHRHSQLEQDIACLSGIYIFLKLSAGLTNNPYLVNCVNNPNLIYSQENSSQSLLLQSLMEQRQAVIKDQQTQQKEIIKINKIYRSPTDILSLTSRIMETKENHELQSRLPKLRTLEDISFVRATIICSMIEKQNELNRSRHQVQLKSGLGSFQQESIRKIELKNRTRGRVRGTRDLLEGRLSHKIVRQLEVICGEGAQMVMGEVGEGEVESREGEFDYPCTNYELMYEYSTDLMLLAGRQEQLYMMQLLCQDVCSFGQLAGWVRQMESFLLRYEDQDK